MRACTKLNLCVRHVGIGCLHLAEHELVLVLDEELRGALHIDEERIDALDVLHLHLHALALLADERSGNDHVNGVAQRRLHSDLGEQRERVVAHLDVLLLTANVQDLPNLLLGVWRGRDDEEAVEQVDRDAVRALVVGAADARDAAVCGHDEHRRQVRLERAVEVREALNVEHVHLVNEEHARHDLRLALLAPLSHLLVNLLADLRLDLSRVAGEEREEALLPRVDHVDLVQADDVHNLLALLQLALGALHELGARAHGVIVARPGEGAAEHADAPRRLVDRDDVARLRLLLRKRVNHFLPEIVDGLHLGGLERQLASLAARRRARRPSHPANGLGASAA
mmetsp:Transcript_15709/g.33590  ORF Transcript_15709/g.33590 Transcript_15709/m.33590 type:complete len:340 (-) Transcript_15709:1208-2227(-)